MYGPGRHRKRGGEWMAFGLYESCGDRNHVASLNPSQTQFKICNAKSFMLSFITVVFGYIS